MNPLANINPFVDELISNYMIWKQVALQLMDEKQKAAEPAPPPAPTA